MVPEQLVAVSGTVLDSGFARRMPGGSTTGAQIPSPLRGRHSMQGDRARPVEMTLAAQVRGILREVLEEPGLPEAAKARLRRLVREHEGHPEQALVAHLHALRNPDGSEEELRAAG